MTDDIVHTREARAHGTARVPFHLYECRMPEMYANVPAHWHGEFELNVILAGEGVLFLDGARCAVSPGDLVVIPPNTLHAAYPRQGGTLHYDAFVFHPSLLGTGGDRSVTDCINPLLSGRLAVRRQLTPEQEGYPALRDCVRQIFSCAREDTARADLLLKSELLRLVYLLEGDAAAVQSRRPEGSDGHAIRPALSYLAEHFTETVTVEQLSARCNLSKSHFMFCFKRSTGMSAMEHLSQLRIRAACEALSGTGRSVAEIAADCGYNNLSNFNRQFKRQVGCSPAQYRKAIARPG